MVSIAEKGGSINLPMEISFQVSSCDEDLTSLNKKIGSYFIDYQQIDCGTGDDFMSYIKSKVSVPVVNSLDEFNDQNTSLIGYQSTIWEGKTKPAVFMVINLEKLGSLNDYIENETFQKLSLDEDKVFNNYHKIGNTVSASIPIAIKDAVNKDQLKKGNNVMLIGFGVGLSWGGSILKW